MNEIGRESSSIKSQATAWLVRRDRGFAAREEDEFRAWCALDPRHEAAVAEMEAIWVVLDRPVEAGHAGLVRARLRALEDASRGRRRFAGWSLAAAACLVAGFLLWTADTTGPRAELAAMTPTARITQPERTLLPDGSSVESRPGTELSVHFTAESRRIVLKSGEAHFSVTKDPSRPFLVEAGAVQVRAVGTAFAVQFGRAEVEVLVTEGAVSVTPPPAVEVAAARPNPGGAGASEPAVLAPTIAAGQRMVVSLGASIAAPAIAVVPSSELIERLAWRLPRLDFTESTIGEAIEMFNRFNRVQLRAGSREVGALRITGVFRSDNIEGFVRALNATLGLRADRGSDEIVIRNTE